MAKVCHLLFAVLVTITFFHGCCKRAPPQEQIDRWGSIANFSRESYEVHDPYIPMAADEVHIPGGNISVLLQHLSTKFDPKAPTTTEDPHIAPHLRFVSVYNQSPKPVIVYRIRHTIDDGLEPKPALVNSYFDFVVQPYTWSRNESIRNDLRSYPDGIDEFGIILGYEGRNLTSAKDLVSPCPKLLVNDIELVEVIVDMPKNSFRLKPHSGPIQSTHLVDYHETPFKHANYPQGIYPYYF